MKKSILSVCWVIVCALASAQSYSQAPQPPLITVSGSAEVKVAPDEVYLRAGVETRHEDLMEAKTQNDKAVSKALAFLKQEVEAKNVQTDFISFEPVYYNQTERTKPVSYVARNSIEIKLANVKSLDRVLSGLLTNGVNTIHGIEFRTSELRKHRDNARSMAIRAAVEKADALAKDLKVTRGKVYNVTASDNWWGGSSSYWGGRYNGYSNLSQNSTQTTGGASEDSAGTLSAGLISVSASVNASFLVE